MGELFVPLEVSWHDDELRAEETWGIDNIAIYAGAAPTVRISSLAYHQAFATTTDNVIPIYAEVLEQLEDPVVGVEFYVNQKFLGTLTNAPFFLTWTNVTPGTHTIRARARAASGLWSDSLVPISVNGLRGDYFNNTTLSGNPVSRIDRRLNLVWNDSNSPIPGVGGLFSARWTGFVVPRYSETYKFVTANDDGVRLWIDNKLLIDAWYNQVGVHTNEIVLEKDWAYPIRLEFFNGKPSGAKIQLFWESPSLARQIIPETCLYPPCAVPTPLTGHLLDSNHGAVEWAIDDCGFHLESAEALAPTG